MHFCCVKSVEVCAVIRYNKTWFIISSCGRAARHSGRVGGRDGKNCISSIGGGGQLDPVELAGHKVVKVTDYKKPEETGLPAANVLIYTLENGATVVVRPSGTEPKIKTYFTTLGKDLAEAQAQKDALAAAIEPILK